MISYSCTLSSYTAGKKGGKLTLAMNAEAAKDFESSLAALRDQPLKLYLAVDAAEVVMQQIRITDDQRKKAYVLIRAIAESMGEDDNTAKNLLKENYCGIKEVAKFSLRDCTKERASDFIDYLVTFCVSEGIPVNERMSDLVEDLEAYQRICIEQKKCCICGRPGEIHHYDALGMGADRKHYDDTDNRKVCLCREHHTEAHSTTMTKEEWCESYHIVPVK